MTLGISSQPNQTNGFTGLGLTSTAPAVSPYAANSFGVQGQAVNPLMNGMMAGAGFNPAYAQAPMTPPSETEILAAMMNTIQPIDRFFIGQSMPIFVEMISNITAFSLLNVLKNSTFNIDDDGNMKMDLSSLPSDLQTLSAENIIAQLNTLQNISQQAVTSALQERDRIIAISEQSFMQTALTSALTNESFLENAGNAVGTTARSFFGLRG
jgi:hypothetical protein|tara:strand:- start:10062 stop:10694 length:633 start_codon:yes stop_codon:yes gene_type:complete